MTAYVFTGPTLCARDAITELDAVYLPPAMAGDVYKVALQQPGAIGIVDGRTHRVSAVWHKEILWAMSQGIHVFGSAGVGALRAAELARFGMVGVGKIFEEFVAGTLEDDDEVAVAYGSREAGFPSLSEPMVNIRATLAAAEVDGVLDPSTRAALEGIAKAIFYTQRSYSLILQRAEEDGMSPAALNDLRDWLPRGELNLKREDALAMLRAMRRQLDADAPKEVAYTVERTTNWDHAIQYWAGQRGHEITGSGASQERSANRKEDQ